MRYIQLSRGEGKTSFQRIIKYGCGPKFVWDRKKNFEMMIKEQGATFWFRVWLTYCTHPECPILLIQQKYPDQFCNAYSLLHEGFVAGSNVIDFCWRVLFIVAIPGRGGARKKKKKHPLEELQDEIHNLVKLNFAIVLCEVFYEWLLARSVEDESKLTYWALPEKYLDPQFKPGPLEKYLALYWKNIIYEFLGINEKQLPWLGTILHGKHKRVTKIKDDGTEEVKRCSRKVRLYVDCLDKLIKTRDETRDEPKKKK